MLRGMHHILDDLVVALGSENVYVASRENPQPAAYSAYVARSKANGQVIALADKARSMLGREPQNIEVVPLLRQGVPESPQMFGEFLQRVVRRHFRSARMVRPRILCSGNFHNALLKQVCTEGLIQIRSRDIMFCEPEIAAAVGMGLNILEPDLRSVMVFERDWTGFMVMSMSGSLTRLRLNTGFDSLLEDIRIYFEESNHVAPLEDDLLAQFLQHGFSGSQSLIGWEAWVDQVERGKPVTFEADGDQFQKAVAPTVLRIKHAINRSLQSLSREQRYTVQTTPLYLAGEYAGLPGFAGLLQRVIGREVCLAPKPAHAMAAGLVSLIPEIELLRAINGGGGEGG
jgi:rod shape-determining protein MreB